MRLVSLLCSLVLPTTLLLTACGDKSDDDTGASTGSGGDDTDDTGDTGDAPVDADGDGVDATEDCDDSDASAYPGADELCDGVDNDCDGAVDNDAVDMATFYEDADGDGYGDAEAPVEACNLEEGLVEDATDCDDTEIAVNPAAEELTCDAVDNDCDGTIDAHLVPTTYATLQAAVDDLADNGEICVEPGTYTEQLDLSGRTLVITGQQGAASTILDVGTTAPMLSVTGESETYGAGDVTLSGFTVTGADLTGDAESGTHGGFAHVEGGTLSLSDLVFTANSGAELDEAGLVGMLVYGRNANVHLADIEVSEIDLITSDTIVGGLVSLEGGELQLETFTVTDLSVVDSGDCVLARTKGAVLYAEGTALEVVGLSVEDSAVRTACSALNYANGAFVYVEEGTGELLDVSVTNSEISLTGSASTSSLEGTVWVQGTTDGLSLTGVDLSDNIWTIDGTINALAYPALYGEQITLDELRVWNNTASATGGRSSVVATVFLINSDADHLDIRGNSFEVDERMGPQVYFEANDGAEVSLSNFIIAGNHAEAADFWGLGIEVYADESELTLRNGDITGNTAEGPADDWTGIIQGGTGDDTTDRIDIVGVQLVGNVHDHDEPMLAINAWSSEEAFTVRYSNITDNSDDTTSRGDFAGSDGNISEAPLYTDVSATDTTTWDLTLQTGSPAIDAGDPSETDDDGSTADMGAYGGPGGSGW